MVHFKSLFGVALLATAVYARPMPQDSAVGDEVGVAAPNGTPITDTVELASQSAAEAAAKTPASEPAVTSSAVHEQPTQPAAHEPAAPYPPAVNHETTTQVHEQPKPTYGSGSNTWGNSEQYNDCVQQCVATYGAPPATWSPTATAGHAGSTPTGAPGATHTVIVAPQQGILRYVPFAVNASVGDTILFRWNANNHTVTKSDQLSLCNKTSDALFASGLQVKDFEFTQVVNSTDPTYFFCAAPNHCQKGMFGIINPPNAFGAPTTVAGQMQNVTSKNPNVAAMASYTNKMTEGSPAANWGRSINLADMPEWSHELVMENVFYTRTFLAQNPETMGEDGVTLSSASTTPLKFPEDISTALNNAGATDPASGAVANAGSSPAASESSGTDAPASSGAANAGNGAMSMSPSITLGAFTLAAFIFLL